MGKRLVIAEKPSLMRTIIRALESTGERFTASDDKEYYESANYIATSQFGHLVELKYPEEYPGREGMAWCLRYIPFFPEKYQYKVQENAKKRFNTIKKLVNSSAVDSILHCGDPGREGHLLVSLVLREAGNTKPVLRPWWTATTEDAILDAIRKAKPDSYYRNVFFEGATRQCLDWDFGINLSQYVSLRTNANPALNIGRVKGAIVTEIYNRDKAIDDFVPEDYFKVISDVEGGFRLTSKEQFKADEEPAAKAWADALQADESIVSDIEEKKVAKSAPKLFSQTTLQAAMSKKFGYKPDQTLELTQSLYEGGYVTYPRTNTEYMAEGEKDVVRDIIDRINRDGYLEFKDLKSIFDDSKIDDHSAIIPTGKRPSSLSDDEKNCYLTILNRFMAVFCKEPCIYNKTTVTIDNPKEQFKVSGEVLVQEGWQKFEPKKKAPEKADKDADEEDDARTLPKVAVGDIIETDFQPVMATTKPPAHYTVTTLGKWMLNPFKKEDSTDEEDYKNILSGLEIGTEATRASTIKVLEEKGYISYKKKTYRIEPRGKFLVEACQMLGIDFSARMTAEMGRQLKAVGKGEANFRDVLDANRAEIQKVIDDNRPTLTDGEERGGRAPAKEKTEPSVYAPTGELVSFSRVWGSHEFTDLEIAELLAGESITFSMVSKKSRKRVKFTGKLSKQSFKGHEYWGFEPEDISGGKPRSGRGSSRRGGSRRRRR